MADGDILERVNSQEHEGDDDDVAEPREETRAATADDPALHVKLHRDEVLRLILLPHESLVDLDDPALGDVAEPEEEEHRRGIGEIETQEELETDAGGEADEDAPRVTTHREPLVGRVLVHPPRRTMGPGEQSDDRRDQQLLHSSPVAVRVVSRAFAWRDPGSPSRPVHPARGALQRGAHSRRSSDSDSRPRRAA